MGRIRKRTFLTIAPEVREKAFAIAKKNNTSLSRLVEKLLIEYIEKNN